MEFPAVMAGLTNNFRRRGMVEFDSVTKNYGRIRAVSDVSFQVREGEILGLLGPNAAGKSTLMRVAVGCIQPTSGAVRVAGFDVATAPDEVKRRVGYLPETPPLYTDMTVGAYLRFVAEIKGVRRGARAARVADVVDKINLRGVEGRLLGNLSRGYKQRVGLAQALITEPPVLILDEPTVGMDPRQIIEIRRLIMGLRGKHTVIYSSHIIPEVSATCDRVVILNQGRALAEGTPAELAESVRESAAVRLVVAAPEAEALDAVRQLPGVKAVYREQSEAGAAAMRVEAPPGMDVRESLLKLLNEKKWALKEINTIEIGLEEVFLRLTERAKDGEAA